MAVCWIGTENWYRRPKSCLRFTMGDKGVEPPLLFDMPVRQGGKSLSLTQFPCSGSESLPAPNLPNKGEKSIMEDERSLSFAVVELLSCPLSQIQVDFLYLQIPLCRQASVPGR